MFRPTTSALAIVFLTLVVGACSKSGSSTTDYRVKEKNIEDNSIPAHSVGYVLTAKESTLLDGLLKDDEYGFVKGEPTLINWFDGIAITASEAAQAYEENQVAADQKFYEKTVLLTGTIRGINSGLGRGGSGILDSAISD